MKPPWATGEIGLDPGQAGVGGKLGGDRKPDHLAMNPMRLTPCGKITGGSVVLS